MLLKDYITAAVSTLEYEVFGFLRALLLNICDRLLTPDWPTSEVAEERD